MSGEIFSVLQVLLAIVFSVLPLVFALWVLLMLRAQAASTDELREQLEAIAAHVGAPVTTQRGARRSRSGLVTTTRRRP